MDKEFVLNAGTIHSRVRNDFMRKGIPWVGSVRINHEGREMYLSLTNYVREGEYDNCYKWTFDTSVTNLLKDY